MQETSKIQHQNSNQNCLPNFRKNKKQAKVIYGLRSYQTRHNLPSCQDSLYGICQLYSLGRIAKKYLKALEDRIAYVILLV